MGLQYKIDVLAELKSHGFSSYRMRSEKLLSEGAIQNIRSGKPISWANIEQICYLLKCQPGDIMQYVEN